MMLAVLVVGTGATGAPATTSRPAAGSTSRGAWDAVTIARPAFFVTTNRNGLPQSRVGAMTFDNRGYLWVGTEDGAAVSNAQRWTVVNMPDRTVSNYVTAICPTSNGDLWFGTREAGVARLSRGQWTSFNTDAGLPSNRIRSVLETSSAGEGHLVWAATEHGLARFDGSSWAEVSLPEGIPVDGLESLFETREPGGASSLWVASASGAARRTSDGWTVFRQANGLPDDHVRCFGSMTGEDGRQVLLAGTRDGLAQFDGTRFIEVGTGHLSSAMINCVRETSTPSGHSVLWIGTEEGLVRYTDGEWRTFTHRDGLPADAVMSLLDFTTSGGARSLFIGQLGGLVQMDFDDWQTLDTSAALPSNLVYAILPAYATDGAETLWVGTQDGLCRLTAEGRKVFRREDGLPANSVNSLALAPGAASEPDVYAATNAGLARFDGGRFVDVPVPPQLVRKEIRVVRAFKDETGASELWAGTLVGLARRVGSAWRVFTTDDGLPSNSVLAVAESHAPGGARTVWAATYGGLARLDGDRWKTVGPAEGFPRGEVISLYVSKRPGGREVLWVGLGDTGVSRLDLSDPNATWLTLNDSTTPALPNNVVYQIREDASGRIYLVTNRGVARLTEVPGANPQAPGFTVRTFTTANGLPNNEGNAGASAVDADGRIWIGTVEGAAVFDPAAEVATTVPLPLHITRSVRGSGIAFTGDGELPHNDSDTTFEYALLDFTGHGATEYRTQLYGLDDTPSDWSTDVKKEYTHIPAGSYQFVVWARDRNGVVSGPVSLAFVVLAAPWRTWWAYALYALAAVVLLYAGLRLRLRALERHNELLEQGIHERTAEIADKIRLVEASERRARDEEQRALEASRAKSLFLANMSHELRTPLNAILGFVQLMDRDRTRSPEDRENLAVIARSGENLLALILDLLTVSRLEAGGTTLDEHAFDLHRLLRGIVEMFGDEAHSRGLRLKSDISQRVPRYVWGDENKLRQALIKILGNSVKFTQRGSIALGADWDEDRLSVRVLDTGRGIPREDLEKILEPFVQSEPDRNNPQGAGLGLTIANSFIRLMGGSLRMSSTPGSGTTVEFDARLPLASGVEVERELQRVAGLADGQKAFRILVVDDLAQNRNLLARTFAEVGLECREASSGDEALQIWERWQPDFVWMDTHMPGMDGLATTREIRRREAADPSRPRTVVVATTTSELASEREEIFSAGFDDYALVPASAASVFEKLAARLGLEYVYETAAPDGEPYSRDFTITPAYLATLPVELRAQLHKAVLEGDVAGAMDVANLVREHDERLATALRALIRSYRFDELQELMEEVR